MAEKKPKAEHLKRGPKSKRTPEIQARLIEALRDGCTRRASCGYAGISESEFYEWLSDTTEFKEAIEASENVAEAGFTRVLKEAATGGDWKAAESWLKRRRREDWGDSVKQEVSGGLAITRTAAELNDDELATLATGSGNGTTEA